MTDHQRECIDLNELAARAAEHRKRHNLSLRAAAEQSGVPFNTLARLEKGTLPDLPNFKRVTEWIGLDPAVFFAPTKTRVETTCEKIRSLLRQDPNLSERSSGQIAELVESLYSNLAIKPNVPCHIQAAPTFVPEAAAQLGSILTTMQDNLVNGAVTFSTSHDPATAVPASTPPAASTDPHPPTTTTKAGSRTPDANHEPA